MKASVLKALVVEGKKPLVRLTGNPWDDAWGEKGMLARITGMRELPHDDLVEFTYDYNEHKEHNLALQGHNYYLKDGGMGTAFEAGLKKIDNIFENVIHGPDEDVPFELVEQDSVLGFYLKSGSTVPYVEWLENKLEELVPDCMKEWKGGLA